MKERTTDCIFYHNYTIDCCKICTTINKEKASEIKRFQRPLVRVVGLKPTTSSSQSWRAISCATPGYSIFAVSEKFPVCGHSCGQSVFLAGIG